MGTRTAAGTQRRRARWAVAAACVAGLLAGCAPDREGGPVPGTAGTPAATTPAPTSSRPTSPAPTSPPPTGEPTPSAPADPPVPGEVVDVATDLAVPWGIAVLDDGAALVTLREEARVVRVDDDGVTPVPAPGPDGTVPDVAARGEGGLLGIAVDGDRVYLYLTTEVDNRVVRMRLAGGELTDPEVVLAGIPAGRNHNGGRLAFGPDGHLYVTTGDAGDTGNAQDLTSLGGKILRVTRDGAPAPGNPFGTPVWSYGHRNVQGLGWAPDGRMFASEFGQNALDELNLIEAGASYGWPMVEGWAGDPEHRDPLVTWTTDEASPSGIAVTPDGIWVAALRGERLWHVPLTADGVGAATSHLDVGRLRAVVEAPGGGLWVLTNNTDGRGDARAGDDRLVHVDVG